jgi:hypothetical protein
MTDSPEWAAARDRDILREIHAEKAGHGSRFAGIATAIEQAQSLSRAWRGHGSAVTGPGNTPWMPFNLIDFAALLLEAAPLIPQPDPDVPPRLAEIGAGPGPNLILARELGFEVHGIEIDKAMAEAARGYGLDVVTADARTWEGYGHYDAIWFNRPLRDAAEQAVLEARVWTQMASGAVVICANLELPPPPHWIIAVDAWDALKRGAWIKPYGPVS